MNGKFIKNPYGSYSGNGRFFESSCVPHIDNQKIQEPDPAPTLLPTQNSPFNAHGQVIINGMRYEESIVRKWASLLDEDEFYIDATPRKTKLIRPPLKLNIPYK